MNKRPSGSDNAKRKDEENSALLKVAQLIDPPGHEVSDDELIDPGKNLGNPPRKPVPARKPSGKR
jgi:hypothetical protein